MKLKLSIILSIGVVGLIVSAMFISSFILKKQYNEIDKTDKYWFYRKLTTQPFKHIKIQQNSSKKDTSNTIPAIYGEIKFVKGSAYSVLANPIHVGGLTDTLSYTVRNDTVFIKTPEHSYFYNNGKNIAFYLNITAPQLESITCDNVSTEVVGLNQENIYINLSAGSEMSFVNNYANMNVIKADLKDKSMLKLSPLLKINTLEVDLKDKSKLKIPTIPIDFLKLQAGDSTFIEAPSKYFNLAK